MKIFSAPSRAKRLLAGAMEPVVAPQGLATEGMIAP